MDTTSNTSLTALVARLARQLDTSSETTQDLLRQLGQLTGRPLALSDAEAATIVEQYRRLGSSHTHRYELLRVLAAAATPSSLATFTQLVVDDPPVDAQGATFAFVPLFQRSDWPVDAVFPAVLPALAHTAVAAVLIDLANYVTRQKRVDTHPAKARVEQLAGLLGQVVGTLGRIEERPQEFAKSAQELTAKVTEALSLVVTLCDALGLIGDPAVAGKLYQARELRHRRIRVEAGAALARLGDKTGVETLVELAAEPVVRSRALAYLEELNELPQAKPEHCTPSAQAVGLLAAWLAQPIRYGVGPIAIEVVDQRTQFWPGYEQPVECFLIRYTMPIGEPPLSGIGIVGPLTSAATHLDLADLSPEMIYAYYVGASVEHELIDETPVDKLPAELLVEWTHLKPALEQAGLSALQLLAHGRFFEYQHWVAEARHDGNRVVIVADGENLGVYPINDRPRSLGPSDWYAIHKGRVVLETFNPAGE
jgi:hypothetical protein